MEILQIDGLNFKYPGAKEWALKDISLTVNEGETVVICGRSGSGKSTLLKLLKPEIAPFGEKNGSIRIAGQELCDDNSQLTGYLSQDTEQCLVTDTVISELAFGLENTGMKNDLMHRKIGEISGYFGLDGIINKRIGELSGGQKQTVAIASVFVLRPQILLLDEPMGNLDPVACDRLTGIINRLKNELGITVIMVEHDLEHACMVADRVIVLNDGQIIADGLANEVIGKVKNDNIYEAFPAVYRLADKLKLKADGISVAEGRRLIRDLKIKNKPEYFKAHTEGQVCLSANNLYFSYDKYSDFVLRGLDAKFFSGSVTGILGSNGSGKSTLIKCLAGGLKPQKGKIKRGGSVALMPQDTKLLFVKDSVRSDYERVAGRDKIDEISKRLNIVGLLDKHPYDLSGGERTLAAVGHMLLKDADIYFFDEPTTGLDVHLKKELALILQSLKKDGKTVIFVTHDTLFAAMCADYMCMFFDGTLTDMEDMRTFFRTNDIFTTKARLIAGELLDAVTIEEIQEAYV